MAAGHLGRAESPRSQQATAAARRSRAADAASKRPAQDGPAFISDQAEEHHYLEVERDPTADSAAKAAARIELARIYEGRGNFAEAVEMYERNVWAGSRTPATYAGLASAYREIGRDDLADAALEQIRRGGGAGRAASPSTSDPAASTTATPRRSGTRAATASSRRRDRSSTASRWSTGLTSSRGAAAQVAQEPVEVGGTRGAFAQVQQALAPYFEGPVGRHTLLATTVLLPVVLGVGIFVAVVYSSARPRTADSLVAPTPAPVATVVPTAAPTAPPAPTAGVPAALSQAPASAQLVVSNTGPEGVSLRRTAGTAGQRIKIWKDGTAMADLGETADVGGQTWRKVRDPEGNVGWTAAEFLADPAASPPGAAPAAPAPPAFSSGGLGLTRAEWEKAHGQPTRSSIFLEYSGGRLVVGLLESNVWHIERVWMRDDAVSLETAREEVKAYLPEDATQVNTIDRGDGRIVDIYASPKLTGRFGPTAWNGGKEGTFSIQYKFRAAADRLVTSAMFRLGDAQF